MGVGPDRDSHADLAGELEQLSVEVLTVGIAVDLDRSVSCLRHGEHGSGPVAPDGMNLEIAPDLLPLAGGGEKARAFGMPPPDHSSYASADARLAREAFHLLRRRR